MRITFLLPGPPTVPVGGYRVVYQYANGLAVRGHRVTVVHAGRLGQFPPPFSRFPGLLRRGWRTWLRAKPLVFPPRVTWHEFVPAVQRRYLFGEPWAERMGDSDAIIATTWTTAEYVNRYPPSKGRRYYLLQHFENWQGHDARVIATWRSPWDERDPSILTLYHPAPWKGAGDALEALRRVHQRRPDVTVTGFGVGPRPENWPSWARYVQNPRPSLLVSLYRAHMIFLNASWKEGFALPPAEAMASGSIFVGTDSGGCRDYACPEETALLSRPRDPGALSDNLLRVLNDDRLRQTLRQRGFHRVRQFTWERAVKALEGYLEEPWSALTLAGNGGDDISTE